MTLKEYKSISIHIFGLCMLFQDSLNMLYTFAKANLSQDSDFTLEID